MARERKNDIKFDVNLNLEQREAKAIILQTPINFLLGNEASGKTLLASQIALDGFFSGQYDKIIITRPAVATEALGFLPGPQPLDAKVLTPEGFVLMGSLRVGDYVIGRAGIPIKITQIRPQGKKMVYRLSTSDGRCTEATEDHLWTTADHNEWRRKATSVKTTKQIKESLKRIRFGREIFNHMLPTHSPINFPKRDLPIDPYVLGVLLGDGSFGKKATPSFVDFEGGAIFQKVSEKLTENAELNICSGGNVAVLAQPKKTQRNKVACKFNVKDLETGEVTTYDSIGDYLEVHPHVNRATAHHRANRDTVIDGKLYFFSERDRDYNNPIKIALHDLGLLGMRSHDKFIPEDYLRSDINDRIEILRGLMDTDGTCKTNGEASFCTTSEELAKGVQDLVRSLGGKCTYRSRDRRDKVHGKVAGRHITTKRICYDVCVAPPIGINPFKLPRKAKRYENAKFRQNILVTSVEEVGVKETQCLVVDSEDHLYLTDDYIVTHNSHGDKLQPYMEGIHQNLFKLYGSTDAKRNKIKKHIEDEDIKIIPIAFTRSLTFDDAIVICDEMQNLTRMQFELVLGRLGKTSKLIFTGSRVQIDLPRTNDSAIHMVDRLIGNEYVSITELKSNHRHPAVASVLETLRK